MKYLHYVFSMLCLMAFVSCNDDPEFFKLESYPDEMHIRSSVESVVLNKGIANQEAVTFTWDAAKSPISSASIPRR